MFRAGLTATNWMGKSTTIQRFVDAHRELSCQTVSLSVILDQCPFPTVEKQTIEASEWMTGKVREICTAAPGEIQLFDRTPVDILAFTLYAQDHTGADAQHIIEQILGLMDCFNTIFYIAIPETWPVGVTPSPEEIQFARLMDSYLCKAIDQFALDVVAMPWDLDAREQMLCQYAGATNFSDGDTS
jgi:hypothetical protein